MEISNNTTIAITFTAAELFALQQALTSAGYVADDERKAQAEQAEILTLLDSTDAKLAKYAAKAAERRSALYLELASRVGHRAGELDEDVPAGFENFPRRADGGLL